MKKVLLIYWVIASAFTAAAADITFSTGFGAHLQLGTSSLSVYPAGKLVLDWTGDSFIIGSGLTAGQIIGGGAELSVHGLYSHAFTDKWYFAVGPYFGGGYSDFLLHFDSSENLFIPHHYQLYTGLILRPFRVEWDSFSMEIMNLKVGTSLVDFFRLLDVNLELINFGIAL